MPVYNPITGGGVGLDTAAGDARYDRLPLASVAALKALTPVDGEVRQTLGYYAANDGGGGPAWTFTLGDTTTAVDGGTVVANDANTGRWKRGLAGAGFRAAFFGAKADGTTDDRAALVAAFAAPTAGDVVHLAPGTYGIASTLTPTARQNINVRGAGMWTTTIKALPAFASANFLSIAPNSGRIVFEDLCFDGSELTTGNVIFVLGRYLKNLVFRRCRFTGMANGKYALTLQEINGAVVEDCVFHTDGTGLGYGLSASAGVRNLALRRNHFRHLQQGAYVTSSGGTADWETNLIEDVLVEGNHFDGAWWLLRERRAGNATYATTSLTDNSAVSSDFAFLDGFDSSTYPNVRLLEPVGTENRAMTITGNSLTDAGQTFVTSGVLRGHLVRATNGTTSLVAFVSGVQSETVLRVEGWLGASDLLPAAAPGTTDAIANWTYSCYKIHLARVTGRSGTMVNVDRWHDLRGNTTSPVNTWRYEILHRRPIYQGFFNDRGRKFRITNNHFQRCWADQLALQGTIDSTVSDNVVESGQDVGITLDNNSRRITCANNVVRHQGGLGIWVAGSHHTVSNNQIRDSIWQLVSTTTNEPGMLHIESTDSIINNNMVLRLDTAMPQAKYGITLRSGAARNRLAGNTSEGHALFDINLKEANVVDNVLRHNKGTIKDSSNGANFFFTVDVRTLDRVHEREDFVVGSVNSGMIGHWNWTLATGTVTLQAPETGRPGILRYNTVATTNTHGGITGRNSGGAFLASEMFDVQMAFRLNDALLGNTQLRIGYGASLADPPGAGFYLEKLTTDTDFVGVTRASNAQTRSASVGAANTGWNTVRIWRASSTAIMFSLNGGAAVTVTANLPTGTVLPFVGMLNSDGVIKSVDLDYFDILLTGLAR